MFPAASDLTGQFLEFSLDGQSYALPTAALEQVIRVVEITNLPKAPAAVSGIINLRGKILPVISLRAVLSLPAKILKCSDKLIIARTARRTVALLADGVVGVRKFGNTDLDSRETALPFPAHLQGIARMEDGLMLIYDLDSFLSLDEERSLDSALSGYAK